MSFSHSYQATNVFFYLGKNQKGELPMAVMFLTDQNKMRNFDRRPHKFHLYQVSENNVFVIDQLETFTASGGHVYDRSENGLAL